MVSRLTPRGPAAASVSIAPLATLKTPFFFQAEDGIRDRDVTGVQTCALPISGAERLLAHAGADAKDQEEGEKQAERGGGLNPRRVVAALALRRVLGDVNGRAAVFTAESEALYEAKPYQHHRRHDAPGGVTGEHADKKCIDAHQRHRHQEGVFAADQVAEMAEDQRAERTDRKAGGKREQREDEPDIRRHVRKEVFCQERAERAVDVKVVPLEYGPQ